MKRSIIECECESGTSSRRVEKRGRGDAVRERDISNCDSLASEGDIQKETRAELTAHNQLWCEGESMLGATVMCRQYSVSTNKTRVCQHAQHANLSVTANTSA